MAARVGIGEEDAGAGGRVDLLSVDREARVAVQHDVELLVPAALPVGLLVLLDDVVSPAVGAVYAFTPNPVTPSA